VVRILTLIRQVLDAQESVRIVNNEVDFEGRKLVMDTMDEYGVEEALRIRESGIDSEIVAISVGPSRVEEALRTALAMGADRAIHVVTDVVLDAIALSDVMANVAQAEQADLILCGGQQADWDSQALGPALAERLHWPQVTWTRDLQLSGTTLIGKHDTDEGVELFELSLPAVITTQQGLNEPRYPTLPNIMKAKKKEIRKAGFETYDVSQKLKLIRIEVQSKARLNKILDGRDAPAAAAQLVQSLRHEARVIR
jgi:electron transfer flavoprotein beta subunit